MYPIRVAEVQPQRLTRSLGRNSSCQRQKRRKRATAMLSRDRPSQAGSAWVKASAVRPRST